MERRLKITELIVGIALWSVASTISWVHKKLKAKKEPDDTGEEEGEKS